MIFTQSVITVIVLIGLIAAFVLTLVADMLNIRRLTPALPDEFKTHYDRATYTRSQEYLKTTTRFGLIRAGADLLALLIFWFSGGFRLIDGLVRGLGLDPILSGLCFTGILLGLKLIFSLPFNVYSTFVIEEKYGFNKTTPGLFFSDLLKGVLLSALLGGTLLALVLLFLKSMGASAWLWCWGASALFILGAQIIVPTWIMPLFNRFTPLEEGALKRAIMEYAAGINFPLKNVFVMDGSKRSSKSNAFFTGLGKNKRIVLFDTLIKDQTVDELVSVLAHEMGHFKKRHIARRIVLGILQMGIIFYLMSFFISHDPLFKAFFLDTPSIYAGLVFFGMLFAPIDLVLSVILGIMSRRDEYEADRFAAQSLENGGQALISALKKLSAANLSNLTPHPFYVFLNDSHPPVLQRIRKLENRS